MIKLHHRWLLRARIGFLGTLFSISSAIAQIPGATPDTVKLRLSSSILTPPSTFSVEISVSLDSAISGAGFGFSWSDTVNWKYDSTVLSSALLSSGFILVTNDTIANALGRVYVGWADIPIPVGHPFPAGPDQLWGNMFFSLKPGKNWQLGSTIIIDSTFVPPAGEWVLTYEGSFMAVSPNFSRPLVLFPIDSDGDGFDDPNDNCPSTPNPSQTDFDADGIGNVCDDCPNDSNNDADGDGVCGDVDNCPIAANTAQIDSDADGTGDACDNCPSIHNPDQSDSDVDSIGNLCDNCITLANPGQADSDGDGIGDACDDCPSIRNPDQSDSDGDGIGNLCDNCITVANPNQRDSDADGIGDACDYLCGDANGDGIVNMADAEYLVAVYFHGGPTTVHPDAGDVNTDGVINIADIMILLFYLNGNIPEMNCTNSPKLPDRPSSYIRTPDGK